MEHGVFGKEKWEGWQRTSEGWKRTEIANEEDLSFWVYDFDTSIHKKRVHIAAHFLILCTYMWVFVCPITVLLEKRDLSIPQPFSVSFIPADSKVTLDLSLLSVAR